MTPAQEICEEAYRVFDAWCAQHDPDGEMGLLEQIDAYWRWYQEQP